MARLLHEASGAAFDLVDEVAPLPGDHLWVYGSDETLVEVSDQTPRGVHLHAHGSGLGVAVLREPERWGRTAVRDAADQLAQDVIAFDQRGCLSPRIVLLQGGDDFAQAALEELQTALSGWQQAVPRGTLSEDERADARRYTQTMGYIARCYDADHAFVALDPNWERLVIPPVGRHLHVTRTHDPLARLLELSSRLTTVGFFHGGSLIGQCVEQIGPRRYVDLGQMQRPRMDGPIDLRTGWSFTTL
jgi:hypothetical protein